MQSEIGVVGVGGLVAQRADHGAYDNRLGTAVVVASGQRSQLLRDLSHR